MLLFEQPQLLTEANIEAGKHSIANLQSS
jgi:hypothetical protein